MGRQEACPFSLFTTITIELPAFHLSSCLTEGTCNRGNRSIENGPQEISHIYFNIQHFQQTVPADLLGTFVVDFSSELPIPVPGPNSC